MTVSDAEFLAWCKQGHRADRVCTIELDRVEEVGGEPETQTLYVSDKPYRQSSSRYHAIVQSVPEFYRELGGDRRSVYSSSYGSILLVSRGGSFDWLLDAALDGSEARFRLGDVAWAIDDHRVMFVALQVMAQRADPEAIEIQIQDRALTLNKSISGQILVGGTGPNADKPRKFNFGNVRQVECDLVDAGSLTYAHSDTGTNTVATAVYDRLTPVGYVDNGDGTQTLDASPDGIITADIVATAPDADPSDVTRHLTSDLIDVSVGLRSGLIAAGVYAGAHPTFTVGDDQDWPIGSSVNDTRNTFDFLADAAKSGQFAYAFTRLGLFTYGRIRPNDIATLPVTPFDIAIDDIGFSEGIEVTHDVPGYYRIQAICDKNWTQTDDVATGLDPDDRALRTRKGLYLKQDDAVGDTYADKPELYDLTLVESPIIETWVSGDGDDTEDEPILASWMEVERFNGLPWLERVQKINVGIEFYEQELMDVARLTFPRFGFDAGELTQVIGIRTKLTEAKIEFTLLRRRLSQPYPEGWERTTTGTDAISVSSFDFDSVSPPIVVPPPGPPLPPPFGSGGGIGILDWMGVNWLKQENIYWLLDNFTGTDPVASRTTDSGLSYANVMYSDNLSPLTVSAGKLVLSSPVAGIYPNFTYGPVPPVALPPSASDWWFAMTATLADGDELGFFAVDDPGTYNGIEFDIVAGAGDVTLIGYMGTSSIILNAPTPATSSSPTTMRVELTENRKLATAFVGSQVCGQHYAEDVAAIAYNGLFLSASPGDFAVDKVEGGQLSLNVAVRETFNSPDGTDPTSGTHHAEKGGPWVVDSVFGQGDTFPTYTIDNHMLRRLTLAENPNADGGESLIRPAGVFAGSVSHFNIDFVVEFDTSSIGYFAIYENAVNPGNSDFICFMGTGVGPTGQAALYSDGTTGTEVAFVPSDATKYVGRLEVNGTTVKFYIEGLLLGTFTRPTQPAFPFGIDLYDPNSDGCAKVRLFKISRATI